MRVFLANLLILVLVLFDFEVVQAQRRPLPATMCGLVNGQVICYDQLSLTPHILTPADQRVIDFAISPDGTWIVYRAGNTVTMTPMYGNPNNIPVDTEARPPADLNTLNTTLVWSPDGLTLAYITTEGLRVAFSPDVAAPDLPTFLNQTDRPYSNLRFSPRGLRLAAQSDDGTWRVFEVNSIAHSLQAVHTIPQQSDMVWLDDQSLIVSYVAGGLARLNRGESGQFTPVWETQTGHYIKLYATSSGEVVAINPDPGDTIGSAVSIGADGKVTALGESKIDSRVRWAADGQMMLYIVSGRPILVNRGTGAENMLPMGNISRVIWAPPQPQLAPTTLLDADLYYLAPDVNGIQQVWRISRSGTEMPRLVTLEPYSVDDYAVSADRTQIAFTSAGRLLVTSLINPRRQKLLAVIPFRDGRSLTSQPAWHPNGEQIAFVNNAVDTGLYLTSTRITGDRKAAPVRISGSGVLKELHFRPQYSPDGRYLSYFYYDGATQTLPFVIDVMTRAQIGTPPGAADGLRWGRDNTLLGWRTGTVWGSDLAAQTQHEIVSLVVRDMQVSDQNTILILRSFGRLSNVVQLYRVAINGSSQPESVGVAGVLGNAILSPTGRFAAGLRHTDTMDQIELLDLQTGRKVWLQTGKNITSLQWVQ